MKTINIYTTPQCGFCQKLKSSLKSRNLQYMSHDVSNNKETLEEMQVLSGGAISVPVTVLNKEEDDQEVFIGYPAIAERLGIESTEKNLQRNKKKLFLLAQNVVISKKVLFLQHPVFHFIIAKDAKK